MLIPNLRNSQYIDIVLGGNLDELATKFAEASACENDSYSDWRKDNLTLNLGHLPSRLLRENNFIDHLLET